MSDILNEYEAASHVEHVEFTSKYEMNLTAIEGFEAVQKVMYLMNTNDPTGKLSTHVSKLEDALIIRLEDEQEEDKEEYGKEKDKGALSRIWEAIKKFFKAIWDAMTFKKKNIESQLNELEQKISAEIKNTTNDTKKSNLEKALQHVIESKKHAHQWFEYVFPATQKLVERINNAAAKQSDDSNAAILEQAKKLKTAIDEVNTIFTEMIAHINENAFSDKADLSGATMGKESNEKLNAKMKEVGDMMTQIEGGLGKLGTSA